MEKELSSEVKTAAEIGVITSQLNHEFQSIVLHTIEGLVDRQCQQEKEKKRL